MFTLTRILGLAASRDTDIEMTPLHFAVARWLSAILWFIATPPSALGKTWASRYVADSLDKYLARTEECPSARIETSF